MKTTGGFVPKFSQPAWTEESGLPYPGAENLAEEIAKDEERAAIEVEAKREKNKALARKKGIADAEAEFQAKRKVVATSGASIKIRRQKWLWRERFPIGGLSLVAGKGDTSKSTLFSCFVAWVTTGQMKGEFYGVPRNVAYVVNEDSIDVTVAPRMIAHGADMNRVHFLKVEDPLLGVVSLRLPQDIDALREHIIENELAAVFVDPLSANVTGRTTKATPGRPTRP
ncbi:AAA family ATPase [Streptomyces sp. NPDC056399]|uniref:AAA family ATPase n=1 Tax=Streptomyces sp. NPDC056399 TaxID=3345807 RepID=UPI0035E25FF4